MIWQEPLKWRDQNQQILLTSFVNILLEKKTTDIYNGWQYLSIGVKKGDTATRSHSISKTAQTEAYITSHLSYAEGRVDIFTDKAIDEVYKYSAGAPRAINKVCSHSLLSAHQRAKRIIDDYMVKEVINKEMA